MIPARHVALYVHFFDFYSRWMVRRHFREVEFKGHVLSRHLPVLMIGNHFSWWDGFIAGLINQEIFRKKMHIMMLEEQLRRRMFLNKAGAYSIKKGSRDTLVSLKYTADLLGDLKNLVVLYPQGEFESAHQYPVTFEKGIEKISSFTENDFQLVFYAALTDYFSHRKPRLSIYLAEIPQSLSVSVTDLESAYNDFLRDCIDQQKPG